MVSLKSLFQTAVEVCYSVIPPYQTRIFPRIQQYIHDLSSALNLPLIVLISSKISRSSSLPVYTQLKTDETSYLQQGNGWNFKCLISVFKFKLVNRQKCLDNMKIEYMNTWIPQNVGILPGKDTVLVLLMYLQ